MKQTDFFKLLLENDKDKLMNFLLSKGKSPKPICPIMFINKEKENEKKMTELEKTINEIKETTKQIAVNRMDEVKVMKCMLNDSEFNIALYDRNGQIGTRCPREEAVGFVSNIVSGSTGLSGKDARHLAENYEFTNKDATFLLNNMKDFLDVYTSTGRKINLIQNANTEASVYIEEKPARTISVPDRQEPGKKKEVQTKAFNKLVCSSTCPKYKEE